MNNTAIFDNKALNQLKKITGSGGGMVLVDELPEIGKEDTLYKTPDGKIWSCINTTETKTICDLEVGKSYKLNSEIELSDFQQFFNKYNDCSFEFKDDGEKYTHFEVREGVIPEQDIHLNLIEYIEDTDEESYIASFTVPEGYTQEKVAITLDGFTEIPLVTITQTFVDQVQNADAELIEFAFLFKGGSHTETTTISTWSEVGGSSGMQLVKILSVDIATLKLTLNKTNEEIYNMLKNGPVFINGYIANAGPETHHAYINSVITSADYYEDETEISPYTFVIINDYDVNTDAGQYTYQIEYSQQDGEWRFKAVE